MPDLEPEPVLDTEPQSSDQPGQTADQSEPASPPVAANITEVDPELLFALGESTEDTPEYGDSILDNLSKIWLPLLKRGMSKDTREKLVKEHLAPNNCKLLQAPKLNAEISAAVPDMVRNRDKTLVASQQQLGAGITAISRGMDILLKGDDKARALKNLSNGCRILCDSHHLASQSRIRLITPSLDKNFLHMIKETERDETLFGSSLSEKIKAAKAIEKQGLQIKKPAKPQKPALVPQSSARPPSSFQGNRSAPPRYSANRGGRGSYRKPLESTARRAYALPAQQPPRAVAQDKLRAPAQSHY